MGTPPGSRSHPRALRGEVGGWSAGATRRNVAFLRSVEPDSLSSGEDVPLVGLALTLTLRDCPATSDVWHKLRRAFLMRLSRMGLHRGHWVVEWQRRGVPHLHGAFWFPEPSSSMGYARLYDEILRHWVALAEPYGVSRSAQHVTPIHDAVGWFQYVAKHAARGVRHYQRASENVPPAWRMRTGRVWGKVGHWATRDPCQFDLTDSTFYRYRRLCRRWRVADARASGSAHRIRSARRCLACSDPDLSHVRGVSEWIPLDLSLLMLDVARGGDEVVQVG